MSTGQLQNINQNDLGSLSIKKNKTVDINILRAKLRVQKNKERTSSYIILSLVCLIVTVTGLMASM